MLETGHLGEEAKTYIHHAEENKNKQTYVTSGLQNINPTGSREHTFSSQ